MWKEKLISCFLLLPSATFVYADDDCTGIVDLAISAAIGDPAAQYNLAVEHWRGQCVDKDLSISRILWKKAASSGLADAYNNYGYLLYYGEGGETDHEGGIEAWKQGTDLGSSEAMIHLANANLDERHLRVNSRRAKILASAAKECAMLEESETHVEMADEVLAKTGTKLKKLDRSEVKLLVLACSSSER